MIDPIPWIAAGLNLAVTIMTIFSAYVLYRKDMASSVETTASTLRRWAEPLEAKILSLELKLDMQAKIIDDQGDELRDLRFGINRLIEQIRAAGLVPIWQPREREDD